MQINSTNNNLSNINNLQQNSLEKISSGLAINSASDNSSTLSISTMLNSQRSTVSQSLSNINSGIAMSNIAQGGLKEQQNILNDISQLTIQAMNGTTSQDGKEAIKNQISNYLDQFNNIAEQTTYGNTQLLSGETQDLSVTNSDDTIIDMESVDTKSISGNIRKFLDNFSSDPSNMDAVLKATQNGMVTLDNFNSQFAASSNQMESSGRDLLSSETSIAQANSGLVEVDYSQAVTNFSKNNLMAQIGALASTQANAIQQRNITLLS